MKLISPFLSIIFSLIISIQFFLSAAFANSAQGDHVPVNILSKHINKVRHGQRDELLLSFPELVNGAYELRFRNLRKKKSAKISFKKNSLRIIRNPDQGVSLLINGEIYQDEFSLRIDANRPGQIFHVRIDKQLRAYPLPLVMKKEREKFYILIFPKIKSFALDSSTAEYGTLSSNFFPARDALAMLIEARARMVLNKKHYPHKEFGFCDLSHCQVYKGRLTSPSSALEPWQIDFQKFKNGLFFHSRCGGQTLNPMVFGNNKIGQPGVKDWLAGEKKYLCPTDQWKRSIALKELDKIIQESRLYKKKEILPRWQLNFQYNQELSRIHLWSGYSYYLFSSESFRIMVNRKKGWNFLKSNLYNARIETAPTGDHIFFKGRGLGHGVGFCQYGALSLAKLGYSKFEILNHYFPQMAFFEQSNDFLSGSPVLSYVTFSLFNGEFLKLSHSSILDREVPPGSFFKILVALYLSSKREDLFDGYVFDCKGRAHFPLKGTIKHENGFTLDCWKRKGHGMVGIKGAISRSCNLFFASLFQKIDFRDFLGFLRHLFSSLEMNIILPRMENGKDEAKILSGLDFRMRIAVKDAVKLIRLLSPQIINDPIIRQLQKYQSKSRLEIIQKALKDTILTGTASKKLSQDKKQRGMHYCLEEIKKGDNLKNLWGKTSTIIHGTNSFASYGLFFGADSKTGIITLIRKGNGFIAAQWAKCLIAHSEVY